MVIIGMTPLPLCLSERNKSQQENVLKSHHFYLNISTSHPQNPCGSLLPDKHNLEGLSVHRLLLVSAIFVFSVSFLSHSITSVPLFFLSSPSFS